MEERTAVGWDQAQKTVCLEHSGNGHLGTNCCSRDKVAVENHAKELHCIDFVDFGNRDSGCLLVLGSCFVDMEVSALAVAFIGQRDSIKEVSSSPLWTMKLLLATPAPSIAKWRSRLWRTVIRTVWCDEAG
jgi:hypothetical protein